MDDRSPTSLAIGIDFGTTNFSVAVFSDGAAKVPGVGKIPSFVYVKDEDIFEVGLERDAQQHPERGIYDIKRLIGRKYNDEKFQSYKGHLAFNIKGLLDYIQIVFYWEDFRQTTLNPSNFYSIILSAIKESVERVFPEVDKIYAVISVPSFFGVSQREVTFEAARRVGFQNFQLLNEPAAIVVGYFEEHEKLNTNEHFLIYDLGGGTFDVALCKATDDFMTSVVATSGDTDFGGYDFNVIIFNHLCNFLLGTPGFDRNLTRDKMFLHKLHIEAEKIKKHLSFSDEYKVNLKDFFPRSRIDHLTITRLEFEKMAHRLFFKTVEIVDTFLKDRKFSKSDLKKVILCGGSLKMPKIKKMLLSYFGDSIPISTDNDDSCYIAKGAALFSAMLFKGYQPDIRYVMGSATDMFVFTRLPITKEMKMIIKKHTPLPCTKAVTYTKLQIRQNIYRLDIYAGIHPNFSEDCLFMSLKLEDLSEDFSIKSAILIKLIITAHGSLAVTATEIDSVKGLNKLKVINLYDAIF